jgi:1-acyl-sn-glycerol-3-phosphate acyltransferase
VPSVYAPFHDGWFNPFLYGYHTRRLTDGLFVVTTKEGLDLPVLGPVLGAVCCVYVNRIKSPGDAPEARIAEIAAKYGEQARRLIALPDRRGIAMNFPEGTRHPQLTMIRAGSTALAGCMAKEFGAPIPVVPVGGAYTSVRDHARAAILPSRDVRRPTIHFGEPIWMGEDVVDRYIDEGWQGITDETNALQAGLARATNTAHLQAHLEPRHYVGKVETRKSRKKQK